MTEARRFSILGSPLQWVSITAGSSEYIGSRHPWEPFVARSWVRLLNRTLWRQRHPVSAHRKAGRDGALGSNSEWGSWPACRAALGPSVHFTLPWELWSLGCQKVALPGPINASRPLRAWPTGLRTATLSAAAKKDLQPERDPLSRLPSYSVVCSTEGCECRRDFAQWKPSVEVLLGKALWVEPYGHPHLFLRSSADSKKTLKCFIFHRS